MKLKTVDVLLVVMRARRTENLKMTMKRSKVVQSMRRRKIMHWTSKLRVIELRKLVKEASLVWTTSALEVYLGQLLHSRCKIYVDKSALCVNWGHVPWTRNIYPNGFWSLPSLVININSSHFWLFLPGTLNMKQWIIKSICWVRLAKCTWSSLKTKMTGSPGQNRPLMWINMSSSWEKICKLIFFQIPVGNGGTESVEGTTRWYLEELGQY